MKQKFSILRNKVKLLKAFLVFIFALSIGCTFGTDESVPQPEKSLNQLKLHAEKALFKSEGNALSAEAMLAEGSGIKTDGHPQVDNHKIVTREIVVPSEVKDRWKAVKILVRNKENEEKGKIQIIELGTSFIPEGSSLKITLGPFLPNFIMDKMTYTSIGNEKLNPAVQLVVEENEEIIYKGWAFKKFPSMYAFEHQVFSIKLLGAVPAVVS